MKRKSFEVDVEACISHESSDPVCKFYTSHPYPPPVENLDRARDMWQDENVHRAEYHVLWPDKEYRPDLDVLVAGCGTWQAAKYALCHPAARVVGIDVSPTSLEHTEKLKQKYNLTNLETRQLPSRTSPTWTNASTTSFVLACCIISLIRMRVCARSGRC